MSEHDNTKNTLDEIVIACRADDDGQVWYAITVPRTMTPMDSVQATLQAAAQIAISSMKDGYRHDPAKVTTLIKGMLTDLVDRFYSALKRNAPESIIGTPPGTKRVTVDPISYLKSRGVSTDPDDHLRDDS